jgi:hypothetical protein
LHKVFIIARWQTHFCILSKQIIKFYIDNSSTSMESPPWVYTGIEGLNQSVFSTTCAPPVNHSCHLTVLIECHVLFENKYLLHC